MFLQSSPCHQDHWWTNLTLPAKTQMKTIHLDTSLGKAPPCNHEEFLEQTHSATKTTSGRSSPCQQGNLWQTSYHATKMLFRKTHHVNNVGTYLWTHGNKQTHRATKTQNVIKKLCPVACRTSEKHSPCHQAKNNLERNPCHQKPWNPNCLWDYRQWLDWYRGLIRPGTVENQRPRAEPCVLNTFPQNCKTMVSAMAFANPPRLEKCEMSCVFDNILKTSC